MAIELPDLGAAIRDYLKESTVLQDADHLNSTTSIYVDWPRDRNNSVSITVPPFKNVIIILPGRGGRGEIGLGQQEERVDIQCYGDGPAKAYKIWRALDFYLNPINVRRKTSFTRRGCQVNYIIREGGPLRLVDNTASDWPFYSSTYLFCYSGAIVS